MAISPKQCDGEKPQEDITDVIEAKLDRALRYMHGPRRHMATRVFIDHLNEPLFSKVTAELTRRYISAGWKSVEWFQEPNGRGTIGLFTERTREEHNEYEQSQKGAEAVETAAEHAERSERPAIGRGRVVAHA